MKRKHTPEGALQRLVLDWLAAKHIFAIRMNVGAILMQESPGTRFLRFGVPGMADILAFPQVNGAPDIVWLELKAPKGKQSELQKSFQAKVESEGHKYLLIRDLSELEEQL